MQEGRRLLRRGDELAFSANYQLAQDHYRQAIAIFKSPRAARDGGVDRGLLNLNRVHRGARSKLSLPLADAYFGMGITSYGQQDYVASIAYIRKSMKIYKWRPLARVSLKMASCHHFMGLAMDEEGSDRTKALRHFQRAIRLQEVLAPSSLKLACSYHDIALCHRHRKQHGDYDESLRYTQMSIRIREAVAPSTITLASTYDNLAFIFREQGVSDMEIEYSLKSIEIRESTSPGCPILSLRYTNLGAAYHNRGLYLQAVEYAKKAIEIQQDKDYPERLQYVLALSIHNLGAAYYGLGKYRTAIEYFLQDIQLRKEQDMSLVGESYYCLGNAYHRCKLYTQAIAAHQASVDIYTQRHDREGEHCKVSNSRHKALANSYLAMGISYSAMRQYEQAIDYMHKALALQKELEDKCKEEDGGATSVDDGARGNNNKTNTTTSTSSTTRALELARTHHALATTHHDANDYTNALHHAMVAVQLRQDVVDKSNSSIEKDKGSNNDKDDNESSSSSPCPNVAMDLSRSHYIVGRCLIALGRDVEAIVFFSKAIETRQVLPASRGFMHIYHSLGIAASQLGLAAK